MTDSAPNITDLGSILSHKRLLDQTPAHVWEAAARPLLPRSHPIAQPATQASITAALRAYSAVKQNIQDEDGVHKRRAASEHICWNPTLSPDLARVFVNCIDNIEGDRCRTTCAVYDLSTGKEEWHDNLADTDVDDLDLLRTVQGALNHPG
ncbi:hypothetical protein WJX73_004859 [Symbiochloris irregularis]|uniref:Uncharacterized protein n=1 Tax=Symbiochloris irregularis TaxID=706552 RepID=A0AAW1PYK7_9CHLO